MAGYALAVADHASPVPLILLILGAAAAWVISLGLWPNAPCTRCKGTGKNIGSNGKRWGRCRRCKGSGSRQRLGSKQVRRALSRKRG